jgi:hypothetical protein
MSLAAHFDGLESGIRHGSVSAFDAAPSHLTFAAGLADVGHSRG